MTAKSRRLLLLLAAFSLWSCGDSPPADSPVARAASFADHTPNGLESFEDGVQQYYLERRSDLQSSLSEGAEPTELAAAVGQLGLWYHAHLYYQEAFEAYALAEALDPTDVAWPYRGGHAARSLGDSEAAAAAWTRVLEKLPDDLQTHIQIGELALAEGDLETAEHHFRSAAVAGDHPRIQVGRGEIALQQGRPEDALKLFTTAVDARPKSRRARYGLGLAYRGLGKFREAQQHLSRAQGAEQDPLLGLEEPRLVAIGQSDTSSMKLWRKGRAALTADRAEEAVRLFTEALEAVPDRTDYRVDLGTALVQGGRVDEAIAAYRMALEQDPQHGGARVALATVFTANQRYAEAEDELRQVLEDQPQHPAAHLHLAHLLRLREKLEDAEAHYQKAIEIDPRSESARFWRVWTLHLLGNSSAALESLEEDLTLLPRRPLLLSLKARLGARSGAPAAEVTAAQDIANRLLAARASAFNVETLAMTLAAAGDWQQAAEHQQKALAAARGAGLSDTSTMESRLDDYRAARLPRTLLDPADMDTVGIALP